MTTGSERSAPRAPLKIRAAVECGGALYPGQLTDVSLTGAQLRFGEPLEPSRVGAGDQVMLVLPGLGDLSAEVIAATELSIRLRFDPLGEPRASHLARFVDEVRKTTFDSFEDWR